MDASQQDMIAQFCAVTGANPSSAQTALNSANWQLEEAVTLYFAAQDEPAERDNDDDDFDYDPEPARESAFAAPTPPQPTAPAARPPPSSSSRPSRQPPSQRPKQMTMEELRKRDEERDNDDSEDENSKGQDMFAGGEKSGLAVQNPGQNNGGGGAGGGGGGPPDHFRNILNQARQNRDRPAAGGGDEASTRQQQQQPRSTNFTGRAQTLGGDDAESQVIEDPDASPTRPGNRGASTASTSGSGGGRERISRTLHLWADGISIDAGPLFRFDDPANANIMAEINRGRAPLALLDVQPDQEVDLNLEPHKDENYVQPKKVWKAFEGGGQRLGSPTPGVGPSSTSTSSSAAAPSSQPTTATSSSSAASVEVDASQPTIQLQIRLGDGTRLQSRFNTTHTIGDVYDFVDRASTAQRPYALMTTFPSKELSDRGVVLGDLGEFRRGGVVVQKWV